MVHPVFIYSLEYLCAKDPFCVHFKDIKPQKALSTDSTWMIRSAQDNSIKMFYTTFEQFYFFKQAPQRKKNGENRREKWEKKSRKLQFKDEFYSWNSF